MGEKQVSLRHDGGLRFVSRTGSGHEVFVDNATSNTGPRPTELILTAIAGCTAMDIVEILAKKRQVVDAYSVEVAGTQRGAGGEDMLRHLLTKAGLNSE